MGAFCNCVYSASFCNVNNNGNANNNNASSVGGVSPDSAMRNE